MNNLVTIQHYYKDEIFLNNGKVIKGSAVIDNTGEFFCLEVNKNIEDFLNDENTFNFLEKFKNKEIFLVGCGENFIIPSLKIKKFIYNSRLKLEWVTTKSAIQVFNLLKEDNRSYFALLINEIK